MAIARNLIVPPGIEGMYHCIVRCVRRAFLCGKDEHSGQDYEHRKSWVKDRLQYLSGIFCVEVAGYAVMSNHLHIVVRTRPDQVLGMSDEEAAERWMLLFPKRRDEAGNPMPPLKREIAVLVAGKKRMLKIRERLSSLSWFMRCVNEFVARKANREDDCKGRFWEGRFKSQALLDEAAVLACMAYVDLNPIRAKIAQTPETSDYTSVQDRIQGREARDAGKQASAAGGGVKTVCVPIETYRDEWLTPISYSEQKDTKGKRGVLPLKLDEYLELVEWSGRMLREDKHGKIPSHLAPIMQRLQIDRENWLKTVEQYGGWFCYAAGRVDSIVKAAEEYGRKWLKGMASSQVAFTQKKDVKTQAG